MTRGLDRFVKPGDVFWVTHTCKGMAVHDTSIVIRRVVPDSFGSIRLEGIRCDGSPIEVVVDPASVTTRPDGAPVRVGAA